MHRILWVITVICLVIGLAACAKTETVTQVGTVMVLAGDKEYIPMENWIFSQSKDGVAADGARKYPPEVGRVLPVVSWHDDLQIVIDGVTTGTPSYTMYGSDDEEIYYGLPEFILPDKPGEYVVSMEIVWGSEETFEGYQYLFAISWPDPEQSDSISVTPTSYPEQAKEDLRQCLDGSVLIHLGRAKDEGRLEFPGMNYSDASMSPNGNQILCKVNVSGGGEARWSGYSVLNLTSDPMEVYPFSGEQWGYQDHVFLSDDLIGFACGAVIGGQEDTWESILLFTNQYHPLGTKLEFAESDDTQIVGIGYDAGKSQYVLACAKNTASGQNMPFSANRLVLAIFDSNGAFLTEHMVSEEYLSPYSPNLLTLRPNNPVVNSEGQILIPVVKREDVDTGNYSRQILLVINPADWSVQELPYGEGLRLSAGGDRAFAVSYDENNVSSPAILDFEGRTEAAVTGIPDTLWDIEGYQNRFQPYDAVMRDHHVYIMAENYTADGDLFFGLFYWDGEGLELLRILPGRGFCSLAGVSTEGNCYVLLHGMAGEQYEDQRAYAETLIGPGATSESIAPADIKSITFPVSDKDKTEFNAKIYEIEPFDVSLKLPDGWMLKEWELNRGYDFITVFSKLLIYNENGECVGVIGYNTYEPYEGAEDNPMAIYGQIALGNNYQFNVKDSYTIVNETDSGTTAAVDVTYSANINNGVEKTNKGLVSYNKDFLVYIAAEFDSSKVTDTQIMSIADSFRISR